MEKMKKSSEFISAGDRSLYLLEAKENGKIKNMLSQEGFIFNNPQWFKAEYCLDEIDIIPKVRSHSSSYFGDTLDMDIILIVDGEGDFTRVTPEEGHSYAGREADVWTDGESLREALKRVKDPKCIIIAWCTSCDDYDSEITMYDTFEVN